jgi:hypothetical protein
VCDSHRIAEWRQIARNVAVYVYGASDDYWSPAPTLYTKAEELKKSYRDGASSLYYQISGWMNWYGSEAMDLRAWVSARLMWDPELEASALIEDFVQGYYGPAAPAVRQALDLVHRRAYDAAGRLRTFNHSKVVPNYVNPRTMRRINRLFERTYASLEDEATQKRLSFAWLPYLWTDFWLGYTGPGQYDPRKRTWAVPMADGAIRNRYGALAKRFFSEHGVNTLRELVQLDPATLGVDKMGLPFAAYPLQDGPVQAVVVPEVGGLIADFRDRERNFAPLKPYWGFKILEYPLFSATEDNVNGVQVTAYSVTESQPGRLVLNSQKDECDIRKTVSLVGGDLEMELSVQARKRAEISAHTGIMFSLVEEVFGLHPSLYLEQKDGAWSRRVMGVETDFWWIEGDLDLRQATGRIVLACQNRPEGVLLTFDPGQLKNLYFWYDTYRQYPDDQWGMLRLFLYARPRTAEVGEVVSLNHSLRILPQASAVLEPGEDQGQ